MPPPAASFDPDAPDPHTHGPDAGWDGLAHAGDPAGVRPDGVWVDPFDDVHEEQWVDPADEVGDDSPTARADRAYGASVDPTTPTAVLRAVARDLTTWDVDSLLAEAALMAGAVDDGAPVATADRPDVVVLRSLLRHPNRPEDLGDVLLDGWLEDPVERSPWPAIVATGAGDPVDLDLLVTAVNEALEASRGADPPAWALVLVAAAAARADGAPVHDLLALVGFPHDEPARLWPDAEGAAKGLPGGVRRRAREGAEALGWDGRRLRDLPAALARAIEGDDRRRRASSFAATLEICAHGPVMATPTSVALPSTAAGTRPYVALIVGSHPVFRLKRDWPDRSDGATGTVWTWDGPQVLESRGLGCSRCRQDRDRDKRYLLSTGDRIADVRLRLLQQVVEHLEQVADDNG